MNYRQEATHVRNCAETIATRVYKMSTDQPGGSVNNNDRPTILNFLPNELLFEVFKVNFLCLSYSLLLI